MYDLDRADSSKKILHQTQRPRVLMQRKLETRSGAERSAGASRLRSVRFIGCSVSMGGERNSRSGRFFN